MDYFQAVTEGRERVKSAVELLEKVVGPSYPMLFLKLGVSPWTPVGREMLHKVVQGKNSTAALVICDSDGNSKSMSGWVPAEKAEEFSRALESEGVHEFAGEVKLPL